MALDLYNAPQDGCGLHTSGGTESIILACLAYREWGKKVKGITKPNIVCSNTAHAAFDKGCFYLGIELRKIPITKDIECDVNALRDRIDSNTVCVVASCPEYAFGKFDPVNIISQIAIENDIGYHLDCCLGGFVNVFSQEAGFPLPYVADFRVAGVTSISSDPHKYGYAPKGSSLLLFSNKQLRRGTFFSLSEWNGGMYITPTMAGTRQGAITAGTWAALMKQGRDG